MRVGIADHFGWAVAVAVAADYTVVDRRRLELVEPDVTAAPIHYDSARLTVAETKALVKKVRASVARATTAAFAELIGGQRQRRQRLYGPDRTTRRAVGSADGVRDHYWVLLAAIRRRR